MPGRAFCVFELPGIAGSAEVRCESLAQMADAVQAAIDASGLRAAPILAFDVAAPIATQLNATCALVNLGQARALPLDVTCGASVRACFDELVSWGVPDVVVNNAGVTVTRALLEQTEQDFDHVLDTNLKGCWLVAAEAARHMVAAGRGGSIINIASILGERVAGGVAWRLMPSPRQAWCRPPR